MIMKVCTHCHQRKTVDHFMRNATMKDGWSSWCRTCFRPVRQARRFDGSLRVASHERVYGRGPIPR